MKQEIQMKNLERFFLVAIPLLTAFALGIFSPHYPLWGPLLVIADVGFAVWAVVCLIRYWRAPALDLVKNALFGVLLVAAGVLGTALLMRYYAVVDLRLAQAVWAIIVGLFLLLTPRQEERIYHVRGPRQWPPTNGDSASDDSGKKRL